MLVFNNDGTASITYSWLLLSAANIDLIGVSGVSGTIPDEVGLLTDLGKFLLERQRHNDQKKNSHARPNRVPPTGVDKVLWKHSHNSWQSF